MEENNNNNVNSNGEQAKSTPYLSKRGQYNPNLKQQAAQTYAAPNQQQPQQPSFNQVPPNQYQTYQGSAAPQPNFNQPNYTYPPMQPQAVKHSGLGIASFVIAIAAIIVSIISFVLLFAGVANLMTSSNLDVNSLSDPNAVNDMMLSGELSGDMASLIGGSLLMFLSMGIAFVGGILGLIAVFQKNRKKVFSILGLIFNALIFVGFIFMFLLGLATSM